MESLNFFLFYFVLDHWMSSLLFYVSAYDNEDPEATRFFVTEDLYNGALVRCAQSIDDWIELMFHP